MNLSLVAIRLSIGSGLGMSTAVATSMAYDARLSMAGAIDSVRSAWQVLAYVEAGHIESLLVSHE